MRRLKNTLVYAAMLALALLFWGGVVYLLKDYFPH